MPSLFATTYEHFAKLRPAFMPRQQDTANSILPLTSPLLRGEKKTLEVRWIDTFVRLTLIMPPFEAPFLLKGETTA